MVHPVRTCLGCGLKTNKGELVRLVMSATALVVDSKGILPGRGTYCCRKAECYHRLMKQRKRLAWVLRCQDPEKMAALANGPGLDAVLGVRADVV
jgi:hypothetical protein